MTPDTMVSTPSIADIAASSGTPVRCAGNLPVTLDDPESVWFIEKGAVNLFLVESEDGVEVAAPQHLLHRTSGWLLPGVVPDRGDQGEDTTLSLVAKGLPGTLLRRLPASSLSPAHAAELAEQVDTWLGAITETLSRFASRIPRPTALAEPGTTRTLAPCTLSVRRGVVWVSEPPPGASQFMGIVDPAEPGAEAGPHAAMIPLTRTSWLTLFDEATLSSESTEALAREGTLLPALRSFHMVAFALERLNRRLAVFDEANLERARTTSRHAAEDSARRRLYNIYDLPTERDAGVEDTSLADALRIVGRREGIDFKIPSRSGPAGTPVGLVDVLDASGVRARRVRLNAEGRWWRGDSTAMLGFRAEDGRPVALLPGMFGRYRQVDPVTGRRVRLTAARADALADEAWMFYRPLPSGNVNPRDLLRIAMHGSSGGSGTARRHRACRRGDQSAAGARPRTRRGCGDDARSGRNGLCGRRSRSRLRPSRCARPPTAEHGIDAARGALRIAARSRLLGPTDAAPP